MIAAESGKVPSSGSTVWSVSLRTAQHAMPLPLPPPPLQPLLLSLQITRVPASLPHDQQLTTSECLAADGMSGTTPWTRDTFGGQAWAVLAAPPASSVSRPHILLMHRCPRPLARCHCGAHKTQCNDRRGHKCRQAALPTAVAILHSADARRFFTSAGW